MSIVSRIQNGEIASLTDNGPRSNNEDREWVYAFQEGPEFPLRAVMAVADGAGQGDAGEVASQIAIQRLQQGVNRLVYEELGGRLLTMSREQLADALEEMLDGSMDALHQEILGMAGTRSATTLTVVFLCQGFFVFGHVGDSRLYLATRSGLSQLTTDQKTPDTGAVMALGSARMQPQIETHGLYGDALVILCSDGVSDVLDERGLLRELSRHANGAQAATGLVEAAKRLGTRDNCTVALGVNGEYKAALPPVTAAPVAAVPATAGGLSQVPLDTRRPSTAAVAGGSGLGGRRKAVVLALLGLMTVCVVGIAIGFLRPDWLGLEEKGQETAAASASEAPLPGGPPVGAGETLDATAGDAPGGLGGEAAQTPPGGEPGRTAREAEPEPARAGGGLASERRDSGDDEQTESLSEADWQQLRIRQSEERAAEAERQAVEARRQAAAARRRAEEEEQARLAAQREAEAAARLAEAESRRRAQQQQEFQKNVADIQEYLNNGDWITADVLLKDLERDHPGRQELKALRENLESRQSRAAEVAEQEREEAEKDQKLLERQQTLIPRFMHEANERPTPGCFNTSLDFMVDLPEDKGHFYILAGKDRGGEYRPFLVRRVEAEGNRRYRVFSPKGRQNDTTAFTESFQRRTKRLREAGTATFFLLYKEEYALIGRPREGDTVGGALYERLQQMPSQVRGFEWPPGSGC